MFHQKIYDMTPKLFAEQLKRSIVAIEEVTGAHPKGYRAPFFTITRRSLWALPILKDLGIEYDASVFPGSNWRYGIEGAPDEPFLLSCEGLDDGLVEFPVSMGVVMGKQMGVGGPTFVSFPIVSPAASSGLAVTRANTPGSIFTRGSWTPVTRWSGFAGKPW